MIEPTTTLPTPITLPLRCARTLNRLMLKFDESPVAATRGGARVRRALAALFALYAVVLAGGEIAAGALPNLQQLLMLMLAGAIFANRGGRFLRDWGLVFAGIFAYVLAGQFADGLDFTVHYTPQIEAEKLLAFGALPTVWLQDHLYRGTTGPLEALAVGMYVSHFFAPLLLGYYLWLRRRGRAFAETMFALLCVSILAEITFVLAPSAPPWLAAKEGLIPPVHHLLKDGLADLHLNAIAELIGDPSRYNVVAAVPSLHAAFPVICLLVILKHGLPRWILAAQSVQLVGVFFAIVYTGDHYVVDAIAGALYASVAWYAVQRALGPAAEHDAVPITSGSEPSRSEAELPEPVAA